VPALGGLRFAALRRPRARVPRFAHGRYESVPPEAVAFYGSAILRAIF
jgi:hypothetical protein